MTHILTATPQIYHDDYYSGDGDRPDLYCLHSGNLTVPYNTPHLFVDCEIYDTHVSNNLSVTLQCTIRKEVPPGSMLYPVDYWFNESDWYYQHHHGAGALNGWTGIQIDKRQGGDWVAGDILCFQFIWYGVAGQTVGLKSIRIY